MQPTDTLRELFRSNDVANRMIFDVARTLSDEQLDRPLDLGPGSLRKICRHIVQGEITWLGRCSGRVETPWDEVNRPLSIDGLFAELAAVTGPRDALLTGLTPERILAEQTYRDSGGSLNVATLHQMLLQMFLHSAHHRAQAVNAIRRVGGKPPEVDYMYSVRKPVRA